MTTMEKDSRTIVIIGSGYVGEMLCDQFSKKDDVRLIITLDKEPQSEFSKTIPKLVYIQHNMADDAIPAIERLQKKFFTANGSGVTSCSY